MGPFLDLVVMGNPPAVAPSAHPGRRGLIFSDWNEKGSANGASFGFGGDGWNGLVSARADSRPFGAPSASKTLARFVNHLRRYFHTRVRSRLTGHFRIGS